MNTDSDGNQTRSAWLRAQMRAWRNRVLLTPVVLLTLHSIPLFATHLVNRLMPVDRSTAIFLSTGRDYGPFSEEFTVAACRYLGYTQVTLRENLNGSKAIWILSPTKEDVLTELAKPDYDNIVFAGHGGNAEFLASDASVTVTDFLDRGIPKRNGTLTMHTCGEGEGTSMAEALLVDPDKVYRWYRVISPFENYVGSWRRVIDADYRPHLED